MCDPTTLAISSAVMQGVGAYQQSQAQKGQAKYQAAVARNNQIIAQRQAEDRRTQGEQEERNFRKKLSTLKGKQRSIYSGSGVVVDEDTALDILGETAELGEIDALTIRNNAEREAYGFDVQAANFGSSAENYQTQASNINPFFDGASTTLTSGVSSAFQLGLFDTPATA